MRCRAQRRPRHTSTARRPTPRAPEATRAWPHLAPAPRTLPLLVLGTREATTLRDPPKKCDEPTTSPPTNQARPHRAAGYALPTRRVFPRNKAYEPARTFP